MRHTRLAIAKNTCKGRSDSRSIANLLAWIKYIINGWKKCITDPQLKDPQQWFRGTIELIPRTPLPSTEHTIVAVST